MFCLKCHSKKLQVVNSRNHIKYAQVWRRRRCTECGYTFTTYETIATDKLRIKIDTKSTAFSDVTLMLSIAQCFEHIPSQRAEHAKWLTHTVVQQLIKTTDGTFTKDVLTTTTYHTLKSFDHLASVQYAARHSNLLKRYLK